MEDYTIYNDRIVKINGKDFNGIYYAYDNCHKIYIIEDMEDYKKATEYGYDIYDLDNIINDYNNSCSLRFIENWKLNNRYVYQFEKAVFELESGKIIEIGVDNYE